LGALEEWGMGRGVPFLRKRDLGKGLCPLPRKFFGFFV